MNNRNFWRSKNVLLTGGTGFVGGNLIKKLLEYNCNIFCIIRNDNPQSFLSIENLNKEIRTIKGDLIDKDLIFNTITEQHIDIIFHLAAQVEVGVGLTNPFLTFETNIRGTYNLLEACRLAKNSGQEILSIIVASSDKAYGEYPIDKMPYQEDYPLLPKYPYDTSKACADLICQSYTIDSYKLPIITTRFSNIYGPGQMNFSAIIPDAIRSGLGYSKFIPRSDGSMVRDFIYAEDVADLYIKISEQLALNPNLLRGQIFNAGNNDPISVKDIIIKVYNILDNKSDLNDILLQMNNKITTGEIQYQHMSFEKVQKYFNWRPTTTFEVGLSKSINWYKDFLEKKF